MQLYESKHSVMKVLASKDKLLDFIYRGILKCDTAELHCQVITLRYSISFLTLQSPRPKLSSSHHCTTSDIIPIGWGHVAEPVRLNPNQFLSNGRRKVPNRVYAQLIQSACGWGKDDCAIMSSLISFHQADRQACSAGLILEGCPLPPGMAGYAQRQIPWLSKGFTGENTGPKPWTGGTERERNVVRQIGR